jgi:hypothetical protein
VRVIMLVPCWLSSERLRVRHSSEHIALVALQQIAKTDVACWTGNGGRWYVALSTGTSWNESDWLGGPIPLDEWFVTPVVGQCFTGDFNGDGITDVACYSGSNGVWAVGLSSGKGW